MEKIEIILTDCIQEIRSGRATLAECLERYPSRRRELEPLLKMALNIQEPPAFPLEPGYKRSAKARLLQQISTTGRGKAGSFANIFSFGLPPRLVWARIAAAVLVGLIIILALGGGTAYASQSSLPGDLLYPVKLETEDIRLLMAGDSAEKFDLLLGFARTRLAEMSKLVSRNSENTDLALRGYRSNLEAAVSTLDTITDTSTQKNLLARFTLRLEEQISFCDQVADANTTSSGPVQAAGETAVNQQIDTLKRLSQQDNLQAARENLNMMQNRLQRAQVTAAGHRYQLMQDALLQYQTFDQLGQLILENVQADPNQASEIDNLSSGALQGYLETLDAIAQQVPREYTDIVKASQELTLQFQIQARHGFQNQNGTDQGSNTAPPGNGSGPGIEQGPPNTSEPRNNTGNEIPGPTPAPEPGTGGNSGGDGGNGPGGAGYGGGASGTNTSPTPSENTDGNAGNGNGTGDGSGHGGGPAFTCGNPFDSTSSAVH